MSMLKERIEESESARSSVDATTIEQIDDLSAHMSSQISELKSSLAQANAQVAEANAEAAVISSLKLQVQIDPRFFTFIIFNDSFIVNACLNQL